MKEILLSVIIPTYNAEKYLPACLDSLKEQDFQSYEVICIDDGSTDKTVGILESYAKDWEKLKLHNQSHKGPGAARNLGLARTRGKYVLFLDSDDEFSDSGVLSCIASEMEAGQLDLLNFGAKVEFADEELKKSRYREEQRYKERESAGLYPTGRELLHELLKREAFLGSACLLALRKAYVEEVGLKFPSLCHSEDEVFCLRAFLGAGRSKHTGQRLYLRRVRQESLTTRPDDIETFRERMKAVWLLQETVDTLGSAPWLENYLAKYMQDVSRRFAALPSEEQAKAGGFSPWEAGFFRLMQLCAKFFARAQAAYIFPWHLFKKGERVVIYGAGNVGKDFVRQLQEYDYVKLAGAVDRTGPAARIPGVEVRYPQDLQTMDCDAILLSVQDKTLADSIKADLQKLGIDEAKIRWDGPHYLQKDFYEGYYFPKISERK